MRRSRVLWVLKAVVSLGLLGWVLHETLAREGVGSLAARLSSLSWSFLAVAAAVQLTAVFAGILRWRTLLSAQGAELPATWLTRSYLIGRFIGTFTPSTAGLDAYRAWDVAQRTGRRALAASTVVAEKLVGLVGLSLATLALLPLGGTRFFGSTAIALAVAVGLGAGGGLALFLRPRLALSLSRALPRGLADRAERWTAALAGRGIAPGALARATVLSLLSHVATAAVFVATAGALGLRVDPLSLLVVGNAIVVATLLPVSVGGIGVREGVAVAMLGVLSVSATDATLVALLGYLVGQVPGIVGGALLLAGSGRTSPKAVPEPSASAPSV